MTTVKTVPPHPAGRCGAVVLRSRQATVVVPESLGGEQPPRARIVAAPTNAVELRTVRVLPNICGELCTHQPHLQRIPGTDATRCPHPSTEAQERKLERDQAARPLASSSSSSTVTRSRWRRRDSRPTRAARPTQTAESTRFRPRK